MSCRERCTLGVIAIASRDPGSTNSVNPNITDLKHGTTFKCHFVFLLW